MSTSMIFRASLTGAPVKALAHAVATDAPWRGVPEELSVDDTAKKPTADWIERWVDGTRDVFAYWNGKRRYLSIEGSRVVKLSDREFPRDVAPVLALLGNVPFTIAVFQTMHLDWLAPPVLYSAPRFGAEHFNLGWGCAFRGAGHDQLVSRRWLEFGPWKLVRGGDDLSLVQFHDLAVDSATALAQARPAHARMGYTPTGGYLTAAHEITHDLKGKYLPARREHRMVVAHRDVSQAEMLDASTARRFGRFPNPVDVVSYVFLEATRARAHLHELWLRELVCLAVIDGDDVRLDEGYAPAPAPPAWVKP